MKAFVSPPLDESQIQHNQPPDLKDYIQLMNFHQPRIDNDIRSGSDDRKKAAKSHENLGDEKQTDILSSKMTG